MKQYMITTNDNPFNPFEDFDNWFGFDIEKGYYSSSRLMRIADLKDDMTDLEVNAEIERAIDEIVKYDFMDTYKKVSKDYPEVEDEEIGITEPE